MSKVRDISNLSNIIKTDASGNVSFVSGSTTLATINTSGQLSGSSPVLSSSYALNADLLDGLDSTQFTLTSSFAAQTASFTAFTSSVNSFTASQNILNGTYATTGSNTFAGIQTINSNLIVTGSITAQTLVVQTITSSVDFVTGSTRFGSVIGNTHVFTGSMSVSGAAVFSEQLTATNPSTLFKEGFIVKATTTGGGGSQPAYTYYTAAGSKRWSSFLNVGDDKLHIANALNSEVFTIIQSGSVGIGTTTPGTRLDVRGVARIGGSSEAVTIGSYTDTYSGYYSVINSTNNGDLSFNSNLYNNGVDLVTVNTHGSMTGASIVLWGNNATLGANTIAFYSRTPGSTTAGTIVSGSNASMVIKGGGNVGIGTITPLTTLDVNGSIGHNNGNTHKSIEFFKTISASTSPANLYTVTIGSANTAVFYEVIIFGADWSGHSAARAIKRGFFCPNGSYTAHNVIESAGLYAANITLGYSQSSNTFTTTLTLDSGTSGLLCHIRLVGDISSYS